MTNEAFATTDPYPRKRIAVLDSAMSYVDTVAGQGPRLFSSTATRPLRISGAT